MSSIFRRRPSTSQASFPFLPSLTRFPLPTLHAPFLQPLDVYNPATEELLATIDTASKEDVDLAVKAARAAFETTWGLNTPAEERGRLLFKFADVIEKNSGEHSNRREGRKGRGRREGRDDEPSSRNDASTKRGPRTVADSFRGVGWGGCVQL